MRVRELRRMLSDPEVSGDMAVLLRVSNEDGDEQMLCSPHSANADPGCGETEMFIIDGTDGECEHGVQADECQETHADEDE